ncbi:MAG: Na-translocating system protein MpsC family protein [Sporolactobacillus sp.]
MKHYNLVNQMVFKVGVTEQKVSVFEDKIIIVAKHKRIPVLEILDEADKNLSGTVDRLLIERSKQLLAERIEQSFGIGVKLILKDYDPLKEVSGTLIFLDRELN